MKWHDVRSVRHGLVLALTLTLGLGAGALTTMAGDSTPFSQADMNAARANTLDKSQAAVEEFRQVSANTHGDLEAARDDVSRLKEQNASLRQGLDDANTTIERLRRRAASAAAEAVEQDLPSAPVEPEATPEPAQLAPQSTPAEADLTVTGVLTTAWILSSRLKPWPTDCSGVLKSYQVRINTGDHATVTIAQLTGSQVTKRSDRGGILTLGCRTTYRAVIPAPVGEVYEFQAVSAGAPEESLRTALVQRSSLASGRAPELSFTFCPTC